MRKNKAISRLHISSVLPNGNESIVPEPTEIKIFHRAHKPGINKILHQGNFKQTISPIRQPGGKTPNRN